MDVAKSETQVLDPTDAKSTSEITPYRDLGLLKIVTASIARVAYKPFCDLLPLTIK
jgi:hypothetical protein